MHIWRTHPHRWAPWIEAASRTPADIVVCDLVAGQLPAPESVPWAVLDDGALVEALAPVSVPVAGSVGQGVDVGTDLCTGVGVGFDWPDKEDAVVRRSLPEPVGQPAVEILGAHDALPRVASGRRLVVVAPPGDPFWLGPFPERVWHAVRVVRVNPESGWHGAGNRVVAACESLLQSDRIEPGS